MDIVIDTNILRSNLKLKDKNIEIILDYLEKTNSKIFLPKIVLEEIIGLYEKMLLERVEDHNRSLIKLNGALIETEISKDFEIDIDFEKKAYEEFIKDRLKLSDESIVPYKNEYLEELVFRAINRKKPLGENGQQFRDGLLWLTLLELTESLNDKRIIFISNNTNDFGNKGTKELSSDLQIEAQEKELEINYYKNISDFVKEYAIKINTITKEWIEDKLNFEQIEQIFNEVISKKDDIIRESYEDSLDSKERATGYISDTDYVNSNVNDYYVYEMSDGRILLNLEIEFEKEYEMEVEREIENDLSDYEYKYHVNPRTGELEYKAVFVPKFNYDFKHDFKMVYPLFRANFVITIRNDEIIDYEIKDWDWG